MRKYSLLAIALICFFATGASAQDLKSILTTVVKTAVGDNATTATSIIGTWNYSGAASAFESDDFLAQAGGSAVSGKINSELEKIYTKIGLNGSVFTFNSDNTYSIKLGMITSTGTYTFDAETKKIIFKTKLGVTVNASVSTLGTQMDIMFKADKLLSALKSLIPCRI